MAAFQNFILLAGYAVGVFFSLWPLIVLSPLGWRRGNIIGGMIAMWVLMFLGWVAVRSTSKNPIVFFIPEPLNTIIFFLTGIVLIAWPILQRIRVSEYIHKTADTARNPQDLLDISPSQFEKMVVEFYKLRGYGAKQTGTTGEHGVDVIVTTPKKEKWVVQCKRWRGAVGEPVVREFFGTMHHEKADRGVLITTGTFTNQASEWARGKPLSLVDGTKFLNAWKKVKNL